MIGLISWDKYITTHIIITMNQQYTKHNIHNIDIQQYTQFAIQDSGLFGPDPWKLIAQIVYVFP